MTSSQVLCFLPAFSSGKLFTDRRAGAREAGPFEGSPGWYLTISISPWALWFFIRCVFPRQRRMSGAVRILTWDYCITGFPSLSCSPLCLRLRDPSPWRYGAVSSPGWPDGALLLPSVPCLSSLSILTWFNTFLLVFLWKRCPRKRKRFDGA